MKSVPKCFLAVALAAATSQPLSAQRTPSPAPIVEPAPPYAVFADLVLAAPVIVDATIRSTSRIKPKEGIGLPPGQVRFYVEADIVALIRGQSSLPPRIGYLLDVTPDARGRLPNLKRMRVLLFARSVPGGAGQLQLVRPDAQRAWTPAANDLARRITTEVVATDAPPQVTGIGNVFHTAGALPGEGETQIFLTTPDGRPVSIGIVRRSGEAPRWGVSLSDVVDDRSGPPPRDTLLWYRMACTLPASLPESAVASGEAADLAIAREDYGVVLASLGRCDRGQR